MGKSKKGMDLEHCGKKHYNLVTEEKTEHHQELHVTVLETLKLSGLLQNDKTKAMNRGIMGLLALCIRMSNKDKWQFMSGSSRK